MDANFVLAYKSNIGQPYAGNDGRAGFREKIPGVRENIKSNELNEQRYAQCQISPTNQCKFTDIAVAQTSWQTSKERDKKSGRETTCSRSCGRCKAGPRADWSFKQSSMGLAIETGSSAGPDYLSKDCLFSMAITSTR